MYNEVIALLAQHKILTLFTFPCQLPRFERLTAVITKEPVMVYLLFWNQLLDYLLLYLFFSFVGLFMKSLLLLLLLLLSSLSLLLSSFGLLSQGVLDVTWILSNRCSSGLLESKIVLGFILIHFLTSLFIFFVNYLNLLVLFWLML